MLRPPFKPLAPHRLRTTEHEARHLGQQLNPRPGSSQSGMPIHLLYSGAFLDVFETTNRAQELKGMWASQIRCLQRVTLDFFRQA
jgi:hypothetical protein